MDVSGCSVSFVFKCQDGKILCLLTDNNVFQLSIISSNVFVSVSPYSVTYCIAIGKDSFRYVLNAILWKMPLLFFGLILDLGLK